MTWFIIGWCSGLAFGFVAAAFIIGAHSGERDD